jgi:two-component system sensor kinase FixL
MSLFDLPPAITELESSDEAIVVVNKEGAVVLMSKPAEELFGVGSEDIVGEFVEFLVPENRRWGHQAYRRGYQVEPANREMDPGLHPELERPDGTLVPIHVQLVPHQIDGELYTAAHVTEREPST